MGDFPFVDSHLDLAENVTLFGRDLTLSAAKIRAIEKRTARQATVSLPELKRGGIAVAFATVTAGFLAQDVGEDFEPQSAIYHTPEEAEAQALTQIKLSLTPTDRHLSDNVIRAVSGRNGVIGLVLYNGFLEPRWKHDKSIVVTLNEHLRRHANYIAHLSGWTYIGTGSDLDGGFGLEESPLEIDTVADLSKIRLVVPDQAREAVLGANWPNFLRSSLPRTA